MAVAVEEATSRRLARRPDERVRGLHLVGFVAVHLLCFAALVSGVTATALVLFAVLFVGRALFVTGGYHRYFSHRSFRLNRAWQLVWAFLAESSGQKGVLWWAANHRAHHRSADTAADLHAPAKGWWWSHAGWFLSARAARPDAALVKDLARFPELRWLDRHAWLPPWTVAVAAFAVGGWSGLFVGFFWSTVLLWHATYLVNSAGHTVGWRRYETSDTSRNSMLLALLTLGEGWHNNHHHAPGSARQGVRWWEVDVTWYFLSACRCVGIVRDPKRPRGRS